MKIKLKYKVKSTFGLDIPLFTNFHLYKHVTLLSNLRKLDDNIKMI